MTIVIEPPAPVSEDAFWAWVEREDAHENRFWKREIQAWVHWPGEVSA